MKAYTLYKGKTNELNVVPLNKQVRFAAPKIIHHDTCFESFDHNMKLVPWNADSPQVISGGPPPQSSPAVHPRRPPPQSGAEKSLLHCKVSLCFWKKIGAASANLFGACVRIHTEMRGVRGWPAHNRLIGFNFVISL